MGIEPIIGRVIEPVTVRVTIATEGGSKIGGSCCQELVLGFGTLDMVSALGRNQVKETVVIPTLYGSRFRVDFTCVDN